MEEHGEVRHRRLPHWDLPGATYFITSCLYGSIPASGLLDLAQFRSKLEAMRRPASVPTEQWTIDCWKRTFARCDDWLDRRPAVRHFSDPVLALIAANACRYWAGRRYDLLAYVVMPSHIHWVFRPYDLGQIDVGQVGNLPQRDVGQVANLPSSRSPRSRIMHTFKLYTARQCNRLLSRRGAFWQNESYDHCVRDDEELERIIHYVEQNPVHAGLVRAAEEWEFSSARDRLAWGIPVGRPLIPPVA